VNVKEGGLGELFKRRDTSRKKLVSVGGFVRGKILTIYSGFGVESAERYGKEGGGRELRCASRNAGFARWSADLVKSQQTLTGRIGTTSRGRNSR